MDNNVKMRMMTEIENKSNMFKKLSNVQYRIRCPFCGDSSKRPTDAHCYIKCDLSNPDEEIKYNCFLCNKGGSNVYKLLKALDADSDILDLVSYSLNNRIGSIKTSNINVMTSNPIMDSPQVRFINERLGYGLTYDDFARFRIIWDMNEIVKYITDVRKLNTLPNNTNRINFLSDNKSMIMSRSFIEDAKESQWRKINLFQNSKSFYVIQSTLDIFTADVIVINIAEGILDILSAYKNFNDGPNSVFISSLGSNYISALNYMMMKGFVGKNINVNIYIDHGINEKLLISEIKRFKWIFGKIRILKNVRYKDIGVTPDKIKLVEVKSYG